MLEKLGLFPAAASTHAGRVDALYLFLIGVSAFFAILIATLIVVFAFKYRRRSDDEQPKLIEGSLALELTWSIVPFGIAMLIFLWGAQLFVSLKTPPKNALDVFVVGRQWMWKVQHLEGRREIDELHVPVGRPVKLTLTSEDVIHSFFVPAFRIKQDAVPGRYTEEWFEATAVGSYHLFCSQYCGTEHSRMIGRVVVMEPADYQAWLSGDGRPAAGANAALATNAAAVSVATAGEGLFKDLGCATCHKSKPGALGPSLAGVFGSQVQLQSGASVAADESYLRESILNPDAKIVAGYQPVMPTFQGQVSEEDLLQLITYIKTLRSS
ncbi:MAG: cytochrome c oxidase subunit II [Deltaproteobacteria bacterium]|nr:cytochrome c oxidase subunit II [Deltaproteobacteria bacterium]